MPDSRSKEAKEYRKLYATARWLRLRSRQLMLEPLCVMCLEQGRYQAATVVDHKAEHKGNISLFFDSDNLQSLCVLHHNVSKQREESRGFVQGVDASGWPIDPGHHWNKA